MGNDTLNNNGHYYRFKVFDSLFIHKKIQFELLVAKSYENEIDSVFLFLQRMGLI